MCFAHNYGKKEQVLLDNLQRTNKLIQLNKDLVNPHFKDGDYQLTLTFKPKMDQYKANYKPDMIIFSSHVRHYLNKVNSEFFGRAFRSKKKQLVVVSIFELNKSQGVHCHMILQKPEISRVHPDNHIAVLTKCWLELRETGYVGANKIDVVYEASGWIDYIFKDTNRNKTDFIDYNNWFLP